MSTVRLKLTRREARARVYDVARMLAGRIPDNQSGELARGFALRLGVVTMAFLKEAYVIKARGGIDAAGERWKPLSPVTIARRMEKGRNRPITRRQQRARERVARAELEYRKAKQRILNSPTARKFYENADRQSAVKRKLWNLRQKLDQAKREYQAAVGSIEILRDTGRLYNSLSPGLTGSVLKDGSLDVRPGAAAFGTNVKYAAKHHYGDGKCPQRRLWPEPSRWPSSWVNELRRAAASGIRRAVEINLRRAA